MLTGSPCSDTRNQPHRAKESEVGSRRRPFRPNVGQAARVLRRMMDMPTL
jgi:hypothetical protein